MTMGFGFGTSDNALIRGYQGSYANPHATIGIKDVPTNIKQVMRLCRFYFMQDAMLGAIIDKMSEYPITQIIISEREEGLTSKLKAKWEHIVNVSLDLRNVMKQINVDKYVFGISFHYLYYPFIRYCICSNCGHMLPIGALNRIRSEPKDEAGKFTLNIYGACPKCSGAGDSVTTERRFRVEDRKSEARNGLTFVRLNPLRIRQEYNPSTGARIWYWHPPPSIRSGMLEGARTIIDSTEMRVLEACYRDQHIKLNADRLWVAQADGLPGIWDGWGIPPVFRVLEDVYYYKVLRRANEALAQEHVTPLRILSPAGTGDISPQRTMNLSDWQSRVRRELFKWKRDPNHIMLSPLPINVEQIGGQARVMMVASEMEAAARVIAAGIGCPIEMIWGGLNWSGASVSLRVLENHFLNDRENCKRLLSFLLPKIATYFRLPRVNGDLTEFKMADDVQQQAQAINLMLQGFLSRKSVVPELGYDSNEEFENLEEEHASLNRITMKDNIEAAHMNTVVMGLEQKAQIMLQFEMELVAQNLQLRAERIRMQDLANHVSLLHQKGYSTPAEFDQASAVLGGLDPVMQQMILQQWQQSMPTVVALLLHKLGTDQAFLDQQAVAPAQQSGAASGPGMEPGAAGPYEDDGSAGAGGTEMSQAEQEEAALQEAQGGEPLPDQLPPRRETSPI